jgi:hypothetical protein
VGAPHEDMLSGMFLFKLRPAPLLREWYSDPHGASIFQKPPTDDVERFLSLLRFDSREKVNTLGRYADLAATKTDNQRFKSPFYQEISTRKDSLFPKHLEIN